MNKEVKELYKEIEKIKSRNKRVEADKAWETSWTRKLFIAAATYITVVVFMIIIGEKQVFLKACIPAVAYVLSSASYDVVKAWWLKQI